LSILLLKVEFLNKTANQSDRLPSLSCLDMDSVHMYQSQMSLKSLEAIPDDLFDSEKKRSQIVSGMQNPSPVKRNHPQLLVYVDQSKVVPSKRISPTGAHYQNYLKSGLNQIQEENSVDLSQTRIENMNSKRGNPQETIDNELLTPNKRAKVLDLHSPKYKVMNSPTFDQASKANTNYMPIKNSFFNSTTNRKPSVKTKEQDNADLFSLENIDPINEKSTKLINVNEFEEPRVCENNDRDVKQEEPKMRKSELRRKYEQQMEKEMLEMNLSNSGGIWGLKTQSPIQI